MAVAQSAFVEIRGFPSGDILKTGVLVVQDVLKHLMNVKTLRPSVSQKEGAW